MLRIGRVASAGLAGWAARLLYVAGFAAGAVGLFIALFASLSQRDPGHDWKFGFEIMAGGFAGSVVGFAGAFIRRFNRRPSRREAADRSVWYWVPYLVYLLTAVALLCLSCALRSIGDWERSNVMVTATLSDCSTETTDSGQTYSCVYDWDISGAHHTQGRAAAAQYPDGQQSELWVDPVTGGADDHGYVGIVFSFIGVGLLGGFDLFFLAALGMAMLENTAGLGRWLDDLAWWRELTQPEPEPTPPAPAPPAPAVIEDAIPMIEDAVPVIEDARPPGY
jgi:hypothetical protein